MWVRRGNLIYLLLSMHPSATCLGVIKIKSCWAQKEYRIKSSSRHVKVSIWRWLWDELEWMAPDIHLSSSRVPGQRKFSNGQFNERVSWWKISCFVRGADWNWPCSLLPVSQAAKQPVRPLSPWAVDKTSCHPATGTHWNDTWMGSPANRQSVGLIMIFRDPLSSHPEHQQQ